jgi:hypothetical protein
MVYRAVCCRVLLRVGLRTALTALICEIYFNSFVELQVTVFSSSWMNIRIIWEFTLICRISECRNATSNQYSKQNHFGLVDPQHGKFVIFQIISKLYYQSVDAL